MESMSVEVFLLIFAYLEAYPLRLAFEGLNTFFQSLLHSSHLRVYFQVRKNELTLPISAPSTFACLPICSIRGLTAGRRRTGSLLRFVDAHISHLPHLRSLTLHMYKFEQINDFRALLLRLPLLECLALICPRLDNTLLASIISLSGLRRLTFQSYLPLLAINDLQCNQALSHLIIKEQIDRKVFLTLLKLLPFLLSFDVAMEQTRDEEHSNWKGVHLSRLKSATFRSDVHIFSTPIGCVWCLWYKDSQYLLQAAPQLTSLTFHFHLCESSIIWDSEDMFDEWGWSHLLSNRTVHGQFTIYPFGKRERLYFVDRLSLSTWFSVTEEGRILRITVRQPLNHFNE